MTNQTDTKALKARKIAELRRAFAEAHSPDGGEHVVPLRLDELEKNVLSWHEAEKAKAVREEKERLSLYLLDVARRNQNALGWGAAYQSLCDVIHMQLSEDGKKLAASKDAEMAGEGKRLPDGRWLSQEDSPKCSCEAVAETMFDNRSGIDSNCSIHGDDHD